MTPLLYVLDQPNVSKWLILDRDGTINRDDGYTHVAEDLCLLPGVVPALSSLSKDGWAFLIATNQSGIARGLYGVTEMEDFHEALVSTLRPIATVAGIAVCPHHPAGSIPEFSGECACRKPKPGLLKSLAARFTRPTDVMVFAGNRGHDREAANHAGVPFHWARDAADWSVLTETLLEIP